MYDHDHYRTVREDVLATLDRYGQDGVRCGGFLTACLENDLAAAVARADCDNKHTLREIAMYIHNELPSGCHGSPGAVAAWIARKRREREEGA